MSNALTIRDEMPLSALGQVLAKSGFFADAKDANKAIVKVLAGRELGFGPIASMTGIYIVKGKPSLSANLMAAAVKRDSRYNYRVERLTDEVCELVFFEGGKEAGRSTFTKADAVKAGTQNMNKFPRNMLFARALSNGVRWHCPDVMSGAPVYTPDELGAEVDGDGEFIPGSYEIVEPPTSPPTASLSDVEKAVTAAGLTKNAYSFASTMAKFTDLDATDQPAVLARFEAYREARTAGSDTGQAARIANATCYVLDSGAELGSKSPDDWRDMVDQIAGLEEPTAKMSKILAHCQTLLVAETPTPLTREEVIAQWDALREKAAALGIEYDAADGDSKAAFAEAIDILSPLVAQAENEIPEEGSDE